MPQSTNEPGADVDPLPPSLDELLGAGHPARFVAEFVDALDGDPYGDPMGAPAYHPRGLLGVWLYGFRGKVQPEAGGGLS